MNDQVTTQLKIVVERAVRPVRAGDTRKRRMREELFEHLAAVYEEEWERSGDEQEAFRRTKERFGDPAELTISLKQSVSHLEYARYLSDLCRYRLGDSLLGFAKRLLLVSFLGMVVMFLLMLPIIWMRGRIGELGIVAHVALVTWLFSAGFTFAFTVIAELLGQSLYGLRASRPRRELIPCIVGTLLVFPLVTAYMYGALMLSLAAAAKGFLLGCLVAPAAPLLFYGLVRQMKEQHLHEREWSGIEIDQ